MKYLIVSFVISLVLALAIYFTGHAFISDDKLVDAAVPIPFAGCKQIAELLEKEMTKRNLTFSKRKDAIPSLDGYSISWPLLAAYGMIIFLSVVETTSLLNGVVAEGSGANEKGAVAIVSISGLPLLILIGYLVGRWIGARSRNHGILAVLTAAFLTAAVDKALTAYFIPAEGFREVFGSEKTVTILLTQTGGLFILLSSSALIGYWRGKGMRLLKYLQFLLAILPSDTSAALVDLAVQEAGRVNLQNSK